MKRNTFMNNKFVIKKLHGWIEKEKEAEKLSHLTEHVLVMVMHQCKKSKQNLFNLKYERRFEGPRVFRLLLVKTYDFNIYTVILDYIGHLSQAAFWYGLVVHLRIYPIIYALPIILLLDPVHFQPGQKPTLVDWSSRTSKSSWDWSNSKITNSRHIWNFFTNLFTWRRVMFGIISGSTFFILTGLCFYLYGWDFLNEALLYHLTRTDPRHNFSIYFYHIYLHYEREFSILEKLIAFLPQFTVQLVLIVCFALDLPFCLFLQTVAFVAFNKVITAQYFVWFFALLPLILPWSNMQLKWKGVACFFLWMGAQTHWLMWGYLLEFRGKNVFFQLWMASLLFLGANTFVIVNIIHSHVYCPLFYQFRANSSKAMKGD